MSSTPKAKIEPSRLLVPETLEGVWPPRSTLGEDPCEVTLRFHRKIYPSEVLREAASAFEELADLEVSPHKTYHEVSFQFPEEGGVLPWREKVLSAFTNHALVRSMERKISR